MIELLQTVLAFIVALAILIAVHEYGHFWVARRLGVKVLKFSIGFGQKLWSWRSRDGETEYMLAAVPLGGYVKMLDEREGDVADDEKHRAFNRQPVGTRIAIVVAGPLFNFFFAILAYWLMFMLGVTGIKPILGEVPQETPAYHAGLQAGQLITSVDDTQTPTWGTVMDALLPKLLLKEPVVLKLEEGGMEFQRTIQLDALEQDIPPEQVFKGTGLQPYRPAIPAVIGEIVADSPAERAGLKAGDEVIAADGEPTPLWSELVKVIQKSPGKPVILEILRDGYPIELEVRPYSVDTESGPVGKIGAGVKFEEGMFDQYRSELRYTPMPAFVAAVEKTWNMSLLTLRLIGEMIMGRASVENISGPITIAQFAKSSALAGVSQFLGFLGIVSLSLGVLNLLPIPILDGGHLLFYIVEILKGKPVSEQAEVIGQKIGLLLILALMFVAFYNDLSRLAG